MSRYMCLVASVFVLLAMSISAYAQGDTDIPILFVNTVDNNVAGAELPEVLLAPAGYTNTQTIRGIDDLLVALNTMRERSVLIFAYHSFNKDADLLQGLQAVAPILEEWVGIGGILMTTVGRDAEEQFLVDLFGLKVSDPGTGMEAIVPVKAPFAKDIADSKLDSSSSGDNTPTHGPIYDEPFPTWVEYVVTTNLAGQPNSVIGRYGAGVLWLGAGFELSNVGTGTDAEQSTFTGFKQLWKNVLDWATATSVTPVEPASKLVSTWGAIRSAY